MAIDRRALFAGAMGPKAPRMGRGYDPALLRRSVERLAELESMQPLSGIKIKRLLAENGISRRTFLKWVSATTALLMLPPRFEPLVAKAAAVTNRIPVIWIECQSCTGNSEALLRAAGPTIDELIFNVISLEYADVLMAASGFQAEQRLQDTIKAYRGKYILIVEGSIPQSLDGAYGTIGPSGTTFIERVQQTADGAAAVIAVGACAFYGGVGGANPNPTGAVGVSEVVKGKPIVNIPACPMNPANLMGTILHFALTGSVPALDNLLRPVFAFGYRIHDNCERRAHFDAGEYVEQWGDLGARNNFCLYKMGCKGPMTYNNCSIIRYNEATNWPIGAGHGCIGCSELDFWDRYAFERPIANADISAPGLFGLGVEGSVDRFGVGLLTAATAGIALHAVITGAASRRRAAAARGGDGKAPEPAAPDATKGDEES